MRAATSTFSKSHQQPSFALVLLQRFHAVQSKKVSSILLVAPPPPPPGVAVVAANNSASSPSSSSSENSNNIINENNNISRHLDRNWLSRFVVNIYNFVELLDVTDSGFVKQGKNALYN